jgi:hypothetical protein
MCHFVEHDIGAADVCDGFIAANDPVASRTASPATMANRETVDRMLSISMTILLGDALSDFPIGSLDCIYRRRRDPGVYPEDHRFQFNSEGGVGVRGITEGGSIAQG